MKKTKRKTNDGRCEECDARRSERREDEQHMPTRMRITPVVDCSISSFYIAFGAVQVFLNLSVLALQVSLIRAQNRFICATYSAIN